MSRTETTHAERLSAELRAFFSKGRLVPRDAVEWARRHPKSALHSELDWDDEHAAEEYRVWQVRRLVAIHVVYEDSGARAAVSLSIDRVDGGGYRQVEDVVRVPDLRDVMLRDALAELNRVRAKYERLTDLASVWAEVRAVEAKRAAKEKRKADRGTGAPGPVEVLAETKAKRAPAAAVIAARGNGRGNGRAAQGAR